jgi:hypothetical protein
MGTRAFARILLKGQARTPALPWQLSTGTFMSRTPWNISHRVPADFNVNLKVSTLEVIAKPSGFAGNAGKNPHYSRKGGRDYRVPGGFAITSLM